MSHYSLLITVSVGMFMIVMVGGEWMLRTAPKQPRAATQPQAQPPTQPARTAEIPTVTEVDFDSKKDEKHENQPVAPQPETEVPIPTVRTRPVRSRPVVTQPEAKPPTQTRLVHCIYCGSKIPSTAVFCDKCGKGQP